MKVRLKDLGTIFTGNTPSKRVDEYWDNSDIKFIKPDIIKDELCVISSANEYISAGAKNASRIVPANSVLVTCIGNIGRVGITEEEVAFNQQINAIVPNRTIIPKYLAYAIYANRKQLQAIANAPVVPIINKTQFSDFEISICESLEKQNKIVRILDTISEIITHNKKKIEALDDLIKARFVEMFGDFDLAPQCNEWIKLSKLGEIVSGSTPKTGTAEYWDGDICWITPAELNSMSGIVYDSKKKITEAGRNSCSLRLMPINTVILSSRAPIGKVAILGKEMCCNQGFKNIICNEKILPKYLYYLLAYNTDYLNSLGRGATFKEISKKIVEDIRISLPSIEQQAKFITFSEQVDKSKFALQNNIISLMNLWYNINQYVCERTYGEA